MMTIDIKAIDVCIPTWNSARTLELCLKSVVREIPIKRIRIVDNFSTDDTVQIAEKHGASIVQKKCGIGKARQYLIENVTTDYFAFIDSDIVLRCGWFDAVVERMKSNSRIGAVCGLWYSDNPQDRHFWEVWLKRVRPDDPMWERGASLNNSIIRKQALTDILIPEWLNNYEDRFIRSHIITKGYKWVVTKHAECDHLVGETRFWKTILGRKHYGAGLKLWKDIDPNVSMKKFLSEALREPVVSLYTASKSGDPLIIPYRSLGLLFKILGYVGSKGLSHSEMEEDPDYKRQYSKFVRN